MNETLLRKYGHKAADTETFRRIVAESERRGYNRQFDPARLDEVDPEGRHMLTPQLVHQYTALGRHVCCAAFVKLVGKTYKQSAEATGENGLMLDVPMELFEALPVFDGRHLRLGWNRPAFSWLSVAARHELDAVGAGDRR